MAVVTQALRGKALLRFVGAESSPQLLVYSLVLLAAIYFIAAPVAFLLFNSFQISRPGEAPVLSLDGWRLAVSQPDVWISIVNSLRLYVTTSLISWPSAILLAWLMGRTDLPGRYWFEFGFWVAFFLPTLSVVMGWILLLDPDFGLVNQALKGLPFVDGPLFNIYSFWGLVWVHLAHNATAIKVFLITPAFRNIDASMEEASRLAGAGPWNTLRHVVVPLVWPAMSIAFLLGFFRLWQSFEIEQVIGPRFNFYIFGTQIYRMLNAEVPEYGAATALATLVILFVAPLLFIQRRVTAGRQYETVTGQFSTQPTRLGRWKYPAFVIVLLVVTLLTIVPLSTLILGSFMNFFGHFAVKDVWTMSHWRTVLADPVFLLSLKNTMLLSIGAALLGAVTMVLMAYIIVRTTFAGRDTLDLLSWLPQGMPGILLSLGFLWLVLGSPLVRPLYGTIWILVIVTVFGGLTAGVQIIKANLYQLGQELEEAGRLAGASWWYAFGTIVLRLLAPVLVLIATLTFIAAARDVSNVVLLATGQSRTLALLQLDYLIGGAGGGREAASVVSLIMIAIVTGVALLARTFGLRVGIR